MDITDPIDRENFAALAAATERNAEAVQTAARAALDGETNPGVIAALRSFETRAADILQHLQSIAAILKETP